MVSSLIEAEKLVTAEVKKEVASLMDRFEYCMECKIPDASTCCETQDFAHVRL